MKLNFLPRQEQFHVYLTALSIKAGVAADLLKKYVETDGPAGRKDIAEEIKNCRMELKKIMSDMTDELCRSFVTPFDREDIQQFSQYLYRIPKMIERVVQRMELHGLANGGADFSRQVDLIVDEARVMEEMVRDLTIRQKTKHVMEKVTLLHELEQKGDDVLQDLLKSLFTETRDVRDLLLRKDIYDMLEKVIDCYRNAAAVTLQIVLKYG